MGIGVLTQTHDEVRRLAIAGSNLAPGDFRLKKLIPSLEKAGGKVPVLKKVAEAAERVVESSTGDSSEALLDLSTLVTAILYTQGETGIEGPLEDLESVDLGPPVTGASARVLKPLIEALTTSGSGRLEIIRDAHHRGAFRDLRLVNLALAAIDDHYGEIGDLIADKVLPDYGKSIYQQVRSEFDVKGRGGHVRRLRLMHRLDPKATKDLVVEALESGSKEMRVAALDCLRDSGEELQPLLDQATNRNKDVRRAALRGLGRFPADEAVKALVNALSGKDLELATGPAAENASPKLLKYLHENAEAQFQEILETKAKAPRAKVMQRFYLFLDCFTERRDKRTVDFLTACFDRREELVKVKGDAVDGDEIAWKIAQLLVLTQSKQVLKMLGESHEGLPGEVFNCCFVAALASKPVKWVYEQYSPYLLARPSSRKKQDEGVRERKSEVIGLLVEVANRNANDYESYEFVWNVGVRRLLADVKLDPRWLDAAIAADELQLVRALLRPKHKAANVYLSKKLKEFSGKRDGYWEVSGILQSMSEVQHPEFAEQFVATLKRHAEGRKQRRATTTVTGWSG